MIANSVVRARIDKKTKAEASAVPASSSFKRDFRREKSGQPGK